jgi:ankyrin repeat protein
MPRRRIIRFALLLLGFAGPVLAAERATIADAAEHRDTALIRTLVDKKADVNATQVDGTTALHWAAYYEDADTVALLLRAGANVNAANRYGVPPLIVACTNGNAAVVKLLLEAGADANTVAKGGETALMIAARSGKVDAVKALLVRGARHEARERRGQTALMWAAAEGHAPVVKALIESGAEMNVMIDSGFTPFLFAVREGHLEVVRALLEAGAKVNEPLRRREKAPGGPVDSALYKSGRDTSPLMLAVQNGHFELAIALVDAGANPNDMQSGFTPLHALSWVRKPDSSDVSDPSTPAGSGRLTSLQFVREIVKRGANVNFRLEKGAPKLPNTSSRIDSDGATPFLLAADRADVPLMRTLVEVGADPMLPNFTNTTPLMAAAGLGTTEPLEEAGEEPEALEAVKMLLDLGANVNAVDDNGDTAMHGAAYGAYPSVVKLLAERGADPQIWKEKNKFGRTPLFLAEGYHGRLPRPDPPTIEAVTKLMLAAGLSTEGERPAIVDIYEKPAPTGQK